MDPREATGTMGRVVAGLNAFNQRHPWSHNDHYHRWVVRRLPAARGAALDAGCGRGDLVEVLARYFAAVTGVDVDAEMAAASATRFPQLDIRQQSFLDVEGEYDLITMVAVLHHLDHRAALEHARALLRPGGRLLVVGLARMASRHDLAWDTASALLNPVVGLIKHPRRALPSGPDFPVRDPTLSFDEIAGVASSVLPGVRLQRQLFFRYTLEWTKP